MRPDVSGRAFPLFQPLHPQHAAQEFHQEGGAHGKDQQAVGRRDPAQQSPVLAQDHIPEPQGREGDHREIDRRLQRGEGIQRQEGRGPDPHRNRMGRHQPDRDPGQHQDRLFQPVRARQPRAQPAQGLDAGDDECRLDRDGEHDDQGA